MVKESAQVRNLNRFTIFSDSSVGVHIQKQKVTLNKPVYLGQTILDDSKTLMYDFHYNFMLEKIKPRSDIDLLFTDTDSLCYVIRKHDIFEIIKKNKEAEENITINVWIEKIKVDSHVIVKFS